MTLKQGIALAIAAVMMVSAPLLAADPPSESLMAYLRSGKDAEAVELIKRLGVSVIDHRGYEGETPLTVATRLHKLPHLALMLEAGGDPNFANSEGDTPLILALRGGWSEGWSMLLDSKSNPNLANRKGETPLIAAVQMRNPVAVRTLLAHGADPDRADRVAGFSARDYAHRDSRVRELARLIDSMRPKK